MKLTKTLMISIATGAGVLMLMAPWAASQPPGGAAGAPGGSGRGGGGGLRGSAQPLDFDDNTGFQSLFDGTLNQWDGAPGMWDVQDGAIHIDTACGHPTGTTYIIWKGGEVSDFILKYDMKGTQSVNGGMQFLQLSRTGSTLKALEVSRRRTRCWWRRPRWQRRWTWWRPWWQRWFRRIWG